MSRTLLIEAIRLMLEETDDMPPQDKGAYLQNQLNKPYLKGQWEELPRTYEFNAPKGTCWVAEDPNFGKVYLTFNSSTVFKKTGRLRLPGATKYQYQAYLGSYHHDSSREAVRVINGVSVGEGKENAKRDQVRQKMLKLYGIDPLLYLGKIEK